MKKTNFKKMKYGINNTIVVAFAIAIVLLVNILAVLVETRVPGLKIDLTENAVTKIGNETKAVLKTLDDKDVEIDLIYLVGEGEGSTQVRDVLEQYDAYSENITYKMVNYHKEPMLLDSYSIPSDVNVEGAVIVATADKAKVRMIYAANMEISYNGNSVFRLESLVTNAIGVISGDREMTVCFTSGHNEVTERVLINTSGSEEQGGMALISLMRNENIGAYAVDLSVNDISAEDMNLLVIMAPENDFTVAEINKIDDYMLSGGNVLVCLPFGIKLERLESYLATWGIKAENNYVSEGEGSSRYDENGTYFYAKTTQYEAVAPITNKILASYARSISYTQTGDIAADVLLTTSESATAVPIAGNSFDTENMTTGQFDLGCILEKPLNGSFEKTAKLIVTGTPSVWGVAEKLDEEYDMHINYALAETRFGNYEFVMSMLSDVFGENIQSIYVPVKTRQVSILAFSEAQAVWMRRILCIIIPIAVLLAGIIVWLRRRNK